jgi:N-acetylglucosamine-6-sulfatase
MLSGGARRPRGEGRLTATGTASRGRTRKRLRGAARRIAIAAGTTLLILSIPGLAESQDGGGGGNPPDGGGPDAPDAAPGDDTQGGDPNPPPPNIVVIMTDDQSESTMRPRFMPRTHTVLVRPGTKFENFVITTPVCCPSRAGFYTGQYAHNSGVFMNNPGYRSLVEPNNVLPVWLREAGYRTVLVGKFMHGYSDAVPAAATPAPGYTDWHALLANNYYRYRFSDNGEVTRYGNKPKDYATTVINELSSELIQRLSRRERPFFMHVSHVAPHSDRTEGFSCDRAAMPAPRDRGRFSSLRFRKPPSFSEEDISDKPSFIRRLRTFNRTEILNIKRKFRCRASSLQEVDRGVRQIAATLERAGELDETVVAFTGDNGYFHGEHRLRRGKGLPYEEAISQPLVMRVPKAYRDEAPLVHEVPEVVANIDLAPTLLELARAEPCDAEGDCQDLDGRSLMPLLEGRTGAFENRGVLIEYESRSGSGRRKDEGGSCKYHAIRSQDKLYVEHTRIFEASVGHCVDFKEVEHYDLELDPFELQNLFPPATSNLGRQQARLAERLDVLRNCKGTGGGAPSARSSCE